MASFSYLSLFKLTILQIKRHRVALLGVLKLKKKKKNRPRIYPDRFSGVFMVFWGWSLSQFDPNFRGVVN
ncbi:hypothetical protein K1719_040681 [Acacia pycnantha]|nr:hypothetical protein K1719_040681 [Acacia pycnantha]